MRVTGRDREGLSPSAARVLPRVPAPALGSGNGCAGIGLAPLRDERLHTRMPAGPMIHLLFTGGTISMQRDEAAGGNVPAHGGEALVGFAQGLDAIAPYRIENWARVPACHLGPDRLWALRNGCARSPRPGRSAASW